jgi:hypothetical protein
MSLLAITAANPPQLDRVLLLGFLAAFAWLVCWHEQRTSLAFTIGLLASSASLAVFGFVQPGAWPLGIVQAAWTVIAFRRCFKPMHKRLNRDVPPVKSPDRVDLQSRKARLFGSVGSDN